MTTRYQFKYAESMDDWSAGRPNFDKVWAIVRDQLRFHRGEGFTIRSGHDTGPKHRLREIKAILERRLNAEDPDTQFLIRALKDQFGMVMRRHVIEDPIPAQMEAFLKAQIGKPYILDAAGPVAYDCSGLTKDAHQTVVGIELVHKATWQMLDPRVHSIGRSDLKPMDLLFLHGSRYAVEHVATFLDWNGPGGTARVIDAEPHDTKAPAGWPTPNLGTGVRIRPAYGGYYCSFNNLVKIGRLYAVNGRP